ncbi:MAG TPA: hypothetical protein VK428_15350 [Acidimicrobiales bacterium]|nr:hypothetical protein [Acidimicrobiales bacterium]
MTVSVLVLNLAAASAQSSGCGTLPSNNVVYVGCAVPQASSPYTAYAAGQQVDLSAGDTSPQVLTIDGAPYDFPGFSPSDTYGGDLVAIECEYNNGAGGLGDPPNANYCSAQTVAPDSFYALGNDSFDYAAENDGDLVTISGSRGNLVCNASSPCVWYVGEGYNSFAAPHLFSNPFVVGGVGPSFTSGASYTATFTTSDPFSFAVTTSGTPGATISLASGSSLPSGVSLQNPGTPNGTATLSGTNSVAAGTYDFTLVADNGVYPNASQSFALTVPNLALSGGPPSATITCAAGSTCGPYVFSAAGGSGKFVWTDTISSGSFAKGVKFKKGTLTVAPKSKDSASSVTFSVTVTSKAHKHTPSYTASSGDYTLNITG